MTRKQGTMTEKVLHEWEADGEMYKLLDLPMAGLHAVVSDQHSDGTSYWVAANMESLYLEILRLSAELSRARAEGLVEGMREQLEAADEASSEIWALPVIDGREEV